MRLLTSGFGLAEAPRWHPSGCVYVSDVARGGVFAVGPDGTSKVVIPKRRGVGGIALHAGGGIVVSGRSVLHVSDGESRLLLERDGVVWNDLACDSAGRVYVGGSWADPSEQDTQARSAGLFRIDAPGDAVVVMSGLGIANGVAFSPDERLVYVVDSATRLVLVATFDDGEVGEPEVFADLSAGRPADFGFPPRLPTPDGLAADEEGGIWVAIAQSPCVSRYAADGLVDVTLEVPAESVTSVSFGGPQRRDMYLTTESVEDGRGSLFHATSKSTGVVSHVARV